MILHEAWFWGGLFLVFMLLSWFVNDWFDRNVR